MRLADLKVSELTDIIAVISISIGLFMAIWLGQKDLALMLGGALGGVVGMSAKSLGGMRNGI